MNKELLQHPFDPIVNSGTKVLILGSFPSIKSFENNFYYAHPRNQFWPIISSIFNISLPDNSAKQNFALQKGFGLWDTYGALSRASGNSSDTNLKDLQVNDFEQFLQQYPNIIHIFFTGKKAEEGYHKYFSHLKVKTTRLPSTSPAYAAMKRDEKERHYYVIKEILAKDLSV